MSAQVNYIDNYCAVTNKEANLVIPTITTDKDYTIWEAIKDAYKNTENVDLLNLFGKHSVLAFSEFLCENAPRQLFADEEVFNYLININHRINMGTHQVDTTDFDAAMEMIGEVLNSALAKSGRWQVCLTLYYYDPRYNQVYRKVYQNAANDKQLTLHIFELAPRTQQTRAKYAAFDVKNPDLNKVHGPPTQVISKPTFGLTPDPALAKPTFGIAPTTTTTVVTTQVPQQSSFLRPQPTQPTYTPPPQPTYTPPPQPTYTPPQQTYVPPQVTYAPQQPSYTLPQQPTYTPPQQSYEPQQPIYTPPYQQITQQYGPLPVQYTQPTTYAQPQSSTPVMQKMASFWNTKK